MCSFFRYSVVFQNTLERFFCFNSVISDFFCPAWTFGKVVEILLLNFSRIGTSHWFTSQQPNFEITQYLKKTGLLFLLLLKPYNSPVERNRNKYICTAGMNKLGSYRNIYACGKQLVWIANSKSANDASLFLTIAKTNLFPLKCCQFDAATVNWSSEKAVIEIKGS